MICSGATWLPLRRTVLAASRLAAAGAAGGGAASAREAGCRPTVREGGITCPSTYRLAAQGMPSRVIVTFAEKGSARRSSR